MAGLKQEKVSILDLVVLTWLLKVARLDFLGGYLLSLSINYVAMSKDREKRFVRAYKT